MTMRLEKRRGTNQKEGQGFQRVKPVLHAAWAVAWVLTMGTALAQTAPAPTAVSAPKMEPAAAAGPGPGPASVGADAPAPTPRAEPAPGASGPANPIPIPKPNLSSGPSAQAALQTLLSSQVGKADPALREVPVATGAAVAATGAAMVGAQGRVMVNVARGQSLDGLLKQHLAASPLRAEVLRELVRQLNPQAFASGNGLRLLAGARLQLPSHQDQAQHAFGKVLAASTATAQADAEDRGGASATVGARKGWVRYP